jgi:uncharacterized membrane protein YuzA (DUF378 family)
MDTVKPFLTYPVIFTGDRFNKFVDSEIRNMKHWIIANKLYIIGGLAGGVAGFLYWNYVGCVTGTCAITSNPFRSILYFAFMGALLFGMFQKKGRKQDVPD